MLPNSVNLYSEETVDSFEVLPTLTYRMDTVNKRIIGKTDGAEALMQFIRKVLDTSKYAFEIYDWYYGNELLKLVGKPYDYIITELPRIATEALTTDDRVLSLSDFKFDKTGIDKMVASWIVHSVYGDLPFSLEVPL